MVDFYTDLSILFEKNIFANQLLFAIYKIVLELSSSFTNYFLFFFTRNNKDPNAPTSNMNPKYIEFEGFSDVCGKFSTESGILS